MDKSTGYISLYRSIQKHWVWESKPFADGQAWVDLLIRACYENKAISFNSQLVKLEEGEIITSINKLANSWGWSRGKVERFLKRLEADKMLSYQTDNHKTVIKLLNYKEFQTCSKTKRATDGQQTDNRRATSEQQTDTYNKVNNYNKENNYSYASPKRKELIPPDDWKGNV